MLVNLYETYINAKNKDLYFNIFYTGKSYIFSKNYTLLYENKM